MIRASRVAGMGRGAWSARRRFQAGQSAIIAVIVLFLLLFLGAAFIALIANNLRNTQRNATTSESGRYAEAGIRYLDQQLMSSPQGADWRPTPDCPPSAAACGVSLQDPDYFYLQPYHYDTASQSYVGGYTRINFGGPTPTVANSGGRALVRLTYRPDVYAYTAASQTYTVQTPDPNYPMDPSHRFIKLESVGRTGQVDPNDPTTFGNTNSLGQRVELSAYKEIGINDYVRFVTNKDNKPDTFAFGAQNGVVQDYGSNGTSGTLALRNITTLIDGPIRVNGSLTFYGVNNLLFNPNRNDGLFVNGLINLNGVSATATSLGTTDASQVYINEAATGTTPNLFPSQSPEFNTSFPDPTGASSTPVPGVVRDNPRGSDTTSIAVDPSNSDINNTNLRSVPRAQPPTIDYPIGPNNLTRYYALTHDSVPIPTNEASDNPLDSSLTTPGTNGISSAGANGWGQGMYIDNVGDLQTSSPVYPVRGEWLNPQASAGPNTHWFGDKYTPPGVDILLTPRYMILTTSEGSTYFHAPAATINTVGGGAITGLTPGQVLPQQRIIDYSGAGAPAQSGLPTGTPEIEGYPAYAPGQLLDPVTGSTLNANSYYADNVIYAEGNVRIRGVAGGLDSETGKYFQRHITIVSNGTIYVDGNLLRDNVLPSDTSTGAAEVRGKSSLALLAKQYVTVNTTQFLSSDDGRILPERNDDSLPVAYDLGSMFGINQFGERINLGPEDQFNTPPAYVTGAAASPTPPPFCLFFRHAAQFSPSNPAQAGVNLAINPTTTAENYFAFPAGYTPTTVVEPTTLLLQTTSTSAPGYNDDVFSLSATNLASLLPQASPLASKQVGIDNLFQLQYQVDPTVSTSDYLLTRYGVAPLDIRIEAMMYAQEGSFFIIPGPWFNPDPDDTLVNYVGQGNSPQTQTGRRSGENPFDPNADSNVQSNVTRINAYYPFYGQPMDVRITFYGEIAENTTAEIGDQGSWMQKWGWIPDYYGSSGLTGVTRPTGFPALPAARQTAHGPNGYLQFPKNEPTALTQGVAAGSGGGNGIVYQFDNRALSPYQQDASGNYQPLRPDLTRIAYLSSGGTPVYMPLPLVPNLPVEPGLLYFGEDTNVPQ